MSRTLSAALWLLALGVLAAGCSDSKTRYVGDTAGGVTSGTTASATSVAFEVTIENVSDRTFLSSPVSPGVWAVHRAGAGLFQTGARASAGIEQVAEDGQPATLAAEAAAIADVHSSGVFGGLTPGATLTFQVIASPAAGRLSFATMLGQSNDLFLAPGQQGLALFDADGQPVSGDVSAQLQLWDAGTEVDEVPGGGLDAGVRQAAPDTGAREGVVRPFRGATRALPQAGALVEASVSQAGGTFTVRLKNVAKDRGALVSALSPAFYAVHDGSYHLLTLGDPAPRNGLERLAEDGDPREAERYAWANRGVLDAGASGAIAPGGEAVLTLQPRGTYSRLVVASMVVESNDAFVTTEAELLDASGAPRAAAAVEADLNRNLILWDAGTEANQVPGAGTNQPLRQATPNTGPADPDPRVRRYDDTTNDFDAQHLPSYLSVSVDRRGSSFRLTVTNTSRNGALDGGLSPLTWALHDGRLRLADDGLPATTGIERIAEDGDTQDLLTALGLRPGVNGSGVVDVAAGTTTPGPIHHGQSYVVDVTPDTVHRFLSLVTMPYPTNDTIITVDQGGVALLDLNGTPRSEAAINADLQRLLAAFDAGTEANETGAAGPHQPPLQPGPNTGAAEGAGRVRVYDGVWHYPLAGRLLRVTIRPLASNTPAPAAPPTGTTPAPQPPVTPTPQPTGANGTPTFSADILPILRSPPGASQSSCVVCHGPTSQRMLKLSANLTDVDADYQAVVSFTNAANPEASLVIQKPSLQVNHLGGELIPRGTPQYDTLLRWVAAGSPK